MKGSFSAEYAALIVVVAAALIGMSVYVKRALMGRWRQVGDSFGYGRQYDPNATTEKATMVCVTKNGNLECYQP